jgi:hypothetical protein
MREHPDTKTVSINKSFFTKKAKEKSEGLHEKFMRFRAAQGKEKDALENDIRNILSELEKLRLKGELLNNNDPKLSQSIHGQKKASLMISRKKDVFDIHIPLGDA